MMIRKATQQDIPRIAEIMVFGKRIAYRPIFQNDIVSFNEIQVIHVIDEYRNNPSLIEDMLVYDDGIVKGMLNRKIDNNEVELYEFYVEPFFQRNGIGRKLIQHAIAEAKERKQKRMFLWVIEDNVSARAFYEANGFRPTGDTCIIEGTTKTDMCYELEI